MTYMDMDVTLADFVKQSCVYKDIRRCYQDHISNDYMAMCHEGIIKFTEEFDSLMYDFSAYLDDMGVRYPTDNAADRSDTVQELMYWVARLADNQFAVSTLCMYLFEYEFEQTQLYIASTFPSFYNHVNDCGVIFPSVSTALGLINS